VGVPDRAHREAHACVVAATAKLDRGILHMLRNGTGYSLANEAPARGLSKRSLGTPTSATMRTTPRSRQGGWQPCGSGITLR
jgi:hypothetical protein